MKNILVLSHDLPSPDSANTLPVYHLIKNLSTDYNIKLVSLLWKSGKPVQQDIEKFCSIEELFPIPEYNNKKKQLTYTIKKMFNLTNLGSKNPSFLNYYYHPTMQQKVERLLSQKKFDIIIADYQMAHYVQNEYIPKMVYALDAVSGYSYEMYKKASIKDKFFWLFQYYKQRHYERGVFKHFDVCIVVNEKDKQLLKEILPHTNIEVVPNGVDIEYFHPHDVEEDYPTVTFVGDMSTPPNVDAVNYFYTEIYPLIKKEIPSIKFYIVGRNPVPEVRKLSRDPSVEVTGGVEDVRPYTTKSSLIVVPMVSGTGIKNKILEAMAMAKAVVTTSMGASGIEVDDGENIIIADDPKDFAQKIIELINNNDLREEIGKNARELTEKRYSWENTTDLLNKIIQEIL